MENELQFARGLEETINRYSMENGSDTPDFILAGYLVGCLRAFNLAVRERDRWHRDGEMRRLSDSPSVNGE